MEAAVSGVSYGIGKGFEALKGKFSKNKTPTTKSTTNLYEENITALKKNTAKRDTIEVALMTSIDMMVRLMNSPMKF